MPIFSIGFNLSIYGMLTANWKWFCNKNISALNGVKKHRAQGRKIPKKDTKRAQKICVSEKKVVKSLIKSNQSGFCDGSDSARKRLKILMSTTENT